MRSAAALLGAGLILASCASGPARTKWSGAPEDSGLFYGYVKVPSNNLRKVSIYKIGRPMLGAGGIGDVGIYEDGSFVVTDLSAGSGYYLQGFWIGNALCSMANVVKGQPFELKPGEMKYLGSWTTENYKENILTGRGSFQIEQIKKPNQVEILKGFLKDPKIADSPWASRIRAEIARLKRDRSRLGNP